MKPNQMLGPKEISIIAKRLLQKYNTPNDLDKHRGLYESTYGKEDYVRIEREFGNQWFRKYFPEPEPPKTLTQTASKTQPVKPSDNKNIPGKKKTSRKNSYSRRRPTTYEDLAKKLMVTYKGLEGLYRNRDRIIRRIGFTDFRGAILAAESLEKAKGTTVERPKDMLRPPESRSSLPLIEKTPEKEKETIHIIPKGQTNIEAWQSKVDGFDKHLYGQPGECDCCGRIFSARKGYRVELKNYLLCADCARLIYPKSGRGYMQIISTPMGNKR